MHNMKLFELYAYFFLLFLVNFQYLIFLSLQNEVYMRIMQSIKIQSKVKTTFQNVKILN